MMTTMILISFKIPSQLLDMLDGLVEKGFFMNRSEALREAVRLLVEHYGDNDG